MAKSKGISFNFGANRKPRKSTKAKKAKATKGKAGGGGNAWRAYVGISNAPLPD